MRVASQIPSSGRPWQDKGVEVMASYTSVSAAHSRLIISFSS